MLRRGYAFKVITHLDGLESLPDLVFPSKAEQVELLSAVLLANESDADLGTDIRAGADDLPGTITSKSFGGPNPTGQKSITAAAKRVQGSLNALSGSVFMYIAKHLDTEVYLQRVFHVLCRNSQCSSSEFQAVDNSLNITESFSKQATCQRPAREATQDFQEEV